MWKISILILVIIFPIPVLVFESDVHETLFLMTHELSVEVTQIHSLSKSPIYERFTASSKGLYHNKTVFDDQGGAGMPNDSQVFKKKDFEIQQNMYLEAPIYMVLTSENNVKIDDVDYDLNGYYTIETKYISFINFVLFRLGVYEDKMDII